MAKKSDDQTEAQVPEPVREGMTEAERIMDLTSKVGGVPEGATPAPDPLDPATQAEDLPDYTEGVWAGHVTFNCTRCPYNSLVEKEVIAHVLNNHREPRELQRAPTESVDQWGNPSGLLESVKEQSRTRKG